MSHANAALTARHRLRLARLIVDDDWPIARAAEFFNVSWRTAEKWASRYRQGGPAGMHDRSSARHAQHAETPQPVVRKIVHLRWKQRLGADPDRCPSWPAGIDSARGAGALPAQPALPYRPGHR